MNKVILSILSVSVVAVGLLVSAPTVDAAPPGGGGGGGGGGGTTSCEACESRDVWGRTSYYCASGYPVGVLGCVIVPDSTPTTMNTCRFAKYCLGGNPFPWLGIY